MPPIDYPEQLPVSARRDEISAAIRDHQVVIVAGETGSGKTTQLPKICLELGRGVHGRIGHTQPRRIAARSVAERIAEELRVDLGGVVGYQVRFTDHAGPDTLVKLMTDGILLAEMQHDRMLSAYDTLIIDEAHERSLNIDFLLGYLKQLLPRRPDLKVVITSATIDPERFAAHFADRNGRPAPIVEVSGRTYPVEVRYRPLVEESYDDDEGEPVVRDQTEAVVSACQELLAEGPGDILVFLPGEREIRDTADVLEGTTLRSRGDVEIVPLYARLSAAEQHKVFAPHRGTRVVLATNVAETSLTVPGIRYVVDSGVARISRYSYRTKVQRLPIEPISQASANQRSGRCGRVEAGIAIRLYSEEDHLARPEFTDPEILRTNLASVILQMASLGLGDVARFPFVDPPDRRQVTAGVQLLEELGALQTSTEGDDGQRDRRHRLTRTGRQLAALPVDPRLGRMVLEADRLGVLREVLVVTAALSVQDPRERPVEQQARADQLHARFKHEASDFLTLLNLWRHIRTQQRELSSSAFRRMCRNEHLNYLRIREWQELEAQLRQVAKQIGLTVGPARQSGGDGDAVDEDGVHQALLSGLLSHIGYKDPDAAKAARAAQAGRYLGARNTRFSIFPGSGLFRKQPAYVMAAELVETSRLYARVNAAIQPEWAERLGAHLVKRNHSEPHWSRKRAAVMAYERVTLYGVPLAMDRLVSYGSVDRAVARELFIRHALVYGEWQTRHRFFHDNRALLEEVEELEHRARRRDIVVDEHTLFDFYDARVGEEVVSGAHFDSWWKRARQKNPDLLTFDPEMLVNESAREVTERDYPDAWQEGGLSLPLHYHFSPGAQDDGVTVDVPLSGLNQVTDDALSWQVPGLREDLVVALLRSLPKPLRVSFVPAPNVAKAFLTAVVPGEEPLLDALERHLLASTGVVVPRDAWAWSKVPSHLRPTYRVLDEDGGVVSAGKDLAELKEPLSGRFADALTDAAAEHTRTGQTGWTFGTVERSFEQVRAGHQVRGFPAVVDEGTTVGLQVYGAERDQEVAHRHGVRRLLALTVPSPAARLTEGWTNQQKLALAGSPYPTVAALLDDCVLAALGASMEGHGGPVWDEASFEALRRCRPARGRSRVGGHPRHGAQDPAGVAGDRPRAERIGGHAAAAGDDGHARPGGEAGAPRLRRRHGRGAAGAPAQVPPCGAHPSRAPGRRPEPGPAADGAFPPARGGLPQPGLGPARRPSRTGRAAGGQVAARGVPGQPVGAAARHPSPGLRQPHPQGAGRSLRVSPRPRGAPPPRAGAAAGRGAPCSADVRGRPPGGPCPGPGRPRRAPRSPPPLRGRAVRRPRGRRSSPGHPDHRVTGARHRFGPMSRRLKVATYNLYLGADLSLVLGVEDPDELPARLGEVMRQLGVTSFAGRAATIARILVESELDVVGLQEVSTWRFDGEVVADFGSELLTALEELGEPFERVCGVATFAGAGHVDGPGGEHLVEITGDNLLLRRAGSQVTAVDAGTGLFADALRMEALGGTAVEIARGWCAARCQVDGQEVVVVDTHTEAYDAGSRDAQRDELLRAVDAVADGAPVVLLGDFNATPDQVGLPDAYVDAWSVAGRPDREGVQDGGAEGATCGQRPDLANPDSELTHRIDYVWVRGAEVVAASRAGHREQDRTENGLWPSDHAAVVAEVMI